MFRILTGTRIRRIHMFLGLPDPHPDPLVRGTDPRIRIHTKMSRIPDTAIIHGLTLPLGSCLHQPSSSFFFPSVNVHLLPRSYNSIKHIAAAVQQRRRIFKNILTWFWRIWLEKKVCKIVSGILNKSLWIHNPFYVHHHFPRPSVTPGSCLHQLP